MRRIATVVVAVLVVVSFGIGATTSVAGAQNSTTEMDSNTTVTNNTSLPPGVLLSGVLSMTHANVMGAMEKAKLENAFNRAKTPQESADVAEKNIKQLQNRTKKLKQEKKEIREEYKNGNISRSEYVSRMSVLSQRLENVKEQSAIVENKTGEIPSEILQENGINVSALQELRQNESEMLGGEVSEIAKQISGRPADVGRPDEGERGPPSDVVKDSQDIPVDKNSTEKENGTTKENPGNTPNKNSTEKENGTTKENPEREPGEHTK